MDKITFEMNNEQSINILRNGKLVGHIFSPAGSGGTNTNAIQICGFTEAFDYWGCARFPGYKDIQLLFDSGALASKNTDFSLRECLKCYRSPCQCENRADDLIGKVTIVQNANPFDLRREHNLTDRIKYKDGKKPIYTAEEVEEQLK